MVKTAEEAGVNMITELENQVIVGVIPTEWKLNEGKMLWWKKRWFRNRKLQGTEINRLDCQIVKRVIKKMIWKQADIDAIWFHVRIFNSKHYFYFKTVTGKIFCKKEELYFTFVNLQPLIEFLGVLVGSGEARCR